jgi:hypothetical protein
MDTIVRRLTEKMAALANEGIGGRGSKILGVAVT